LLEERALRTRWTAFNRPDEALLVLLLQLSAIIPKLIVSPAQPEVPP